MNTGKLMMSLVADALGIERGEKTYEPLDEATLSDLYSLSAKHDVAHLVCCGLEKNSLLPDGSECAMRFRKQKFIAVYRYTQQKAELDALRAYFDESGIEYMLLKGSVIRDFYPEGWMRVGCDIDILVKDEDIPRAKEVLVSNGYVYEGAEFHDVHFSSPSGVHLELHHTIVQKLSEVDKILERPFDYSYSPKESSFERAQTPELLYVHFVAHAAHHLLNGGCGVRVFIDLFLMDEKLWQSSDKVDAMLTDTGIFEFAKYSRNLAAYWLLSAEADETVKTYEKIILSGGLYGNFKNRAALRENKEGGFKFIMSRLFLPYDMLKNKYHVLKKHKWLTPVYQVRRWLVLLSPKRMKRASRELSAVGSVTGEQSREAGALLDKLKI